MEYPAATGYTDNNIQSESAVSGYPAIPVGAADIIRSYTPCKLLVPAASQYSGQWLGEGILDPGSGPMIVICYNQDIGDRWEWPGGRNLGSALTVSFQMAINFIFYTPTH